MWLRDASLEGKLPTIEQMTVDPYKYFPYRFGHALWSYIGERWGDEAVGAILKATLAGGVEPAFRRTIGLTLRAALRPVARRGAEAVPARDRRPGPGPRRGRRAADREALGRDAAPRAGPVARRVPGRVLQREGLLLRRPLPGRRGHRQGQAPDPQVGDQQQLRDLPLHQLAGQLVARREVPRLRGQARAARRHRHRGRGAEQAGREDRLEAERGHDAVLEPGRQAAGLHRLRRRLQRPVRGRPRRQEPAPAHRGQVRRPASGLVARRQDHRVRDRPRSRHRLQDARHRQFPDRALRPRHGLDPDPGPDGPGEEREPAVGARTASRSPSCPTATG